MPNQRDIARALRLSQAAVSMALRDDPTIPPETRQRVRREAERLGYRPNADVAGLMARIRLGKPLRQKGCLAILVPAGRRDNWLAKEIYRRHHEGMVRRAEELGYRTELFFPDAPHGDGEGLDRVLQARGIRGLVLASPEHAFPFPPTLDWSRYACATTGYKWTSPLADRVAAHHRRHVDLAFQHLVARGHRRIGMVLPEEACTAVDSAWMAGFCLWHYRLPPERRVSLFVGTPGEVSLASFRSWLRREKPDALVTLLGDEKAWLDALGLKAPRDIGHVCVNRPHDSRVAGVEENHEQAGATAVEMVVSRIMHNEYGLPKIPRLILIGGVWRDGGVARS